MKEKKKLKKEKKFKEEVFDPTEVGIWICPKEERKEHHAWVREICKNQGIDPADIDLNRSCPPGSWTILGKLKTQKPKIQKPRRKRPF